MKNAGYGLIFLIFMIISLVSPGQNTASVSGKIMNEKAKPVEFANISLLGYPGGTTSDSKGLYEIKVPAGISVTLVVSFIGYQTQTYRIELPAGRKETVNVILQRSATELDDVEIIDKQIRNTNLIRLDPKIATKIPTMTGGIEEMIKTLPGVSSTNELSSQYSVRGGNFDENLVYVNGIEIYRPFLIRAGQQEGLSFVNSSLVSSILFSAGGFEAKYGDKMSSVLDIQYIRPTEYAGSVQLSLLGAQAHAEGVSKNKRLGFLVGARYQTNQYFLQGLQTEGDYKPRFGDIQALVSYSLNPRWDLTFLGNYSINSYQLVPSNRETNFGTINEAYRLKIYFEGQEIDRFETMMGAFSADYTPNAETNLKFIASAFQTYESETFDILGQYWIGRLETDFGSEQFGDVVEAQGVGSYLDHARNYLNATVLNLEHKGTKTADNKLLQWGLRYQREMISDKLNEWEMVDSAGFSVPTIPNNAGNSNPANPDLQLFYSLRTEDINLSSNRYNGFLQNTWNYILNNEAALFVTAGLRFNYWDLNNDFLLSPRASVAYKPYWKRDILFRFSTGYYYQPPFYRELRGPDGEINKNLKAQRSIHFVAGMDINFKAWQRPFKFTAEAYFKKLDNLIPYEVDNVRIRYQATNNAHGYAYGMDFKVNGEFIKGVESWASLSLLKTMEDIEDDFYYEYYNAEGEKIIPGYTFDQNPTDSVRFEPGFIPRPTDQRLNFALFFQDYLPKNPTWAMYIKLLFGTGLPFGPPNTEKYSDTLRYPSYKRVDIGFSKQLIGENTAFKPGNPLRAFKSLWISLEIFNLFQIRNTISYLWVKDVNGRQYAVPNYLTPRQINFKIVAKF